MKLKYLFAIGILFNNIHGMAESNLIEKKEVCALLLFWRATDELHFTNKPLVHFAKLNSNESFSKLKLEIGKRFNACDITVNTKNEKKDNPEEVKKSLEEFTFIQSKIPATRFELVTFVKLYVYDEKWIDRRSALEQFKAKL